MKVIRESIFETNSSSTHSISIQGGNYIANTIPVDPTDNVCWIYSGEFGWGEDKFTSAAVKASYCLTYIKNCVPQELVSKLSRMLKKVIKQQTNHKVEFCPINWDKYKGGPDWGYIDHQSEEVCLKAFESEESLRDFIFNPESILVIDNDNH